MTKELKSQELLTLQHTSKTPENENFRRQAKHLIHVFTIRNDLFS